MNIQQVYLSKQFKKLIKYSYRYVILIRFINRYLRNYNKYINCLLFYKEESESMGHGGDEVNFIIKLKLYIIKPYNK